MTTCLEG